jgi:hypothetical protein
MSEPDPVRKPEDGVSEVERRAKDQLPQGKAMFHTPWIITMATVVALGLWIARAGPASHVAMVGIVVVNAIVLGQLLMQHFYWTNSVMMSRPDASRTRTAPENGSDDA